MDRLGMTPYFEGRYTFVDVARFYRALDEIGRSSDVGKAIRCWVLSKHTHVRVVFGPNVTTSGGSGQDDSTPDLNNPPTYSQPDPHPNEGTVNLNTSDPNWVNPDSELHSQYPNEINNGVITLGHELGHAGPGIGDPGVVTLVENPIRNGLGLDPRGAYHGGGVTPTLRDYSRYNDFMNKWKCCYGYE